MEFFKYFISIKSIIDFWNKIFACVFQIIKTISFCYIFSFSISNFCSIRRFPASFFKFSINSFKCYFSISYNLNTIKFISMEFRNVNILERNFWILENPFRRCCKVCVSSTNTDYKVSFFSDFISSYTASFAKTI